MDTLATRDAFAAELNTIFKAQADAETTFEMTLVEVKSVISNKIQECFALLFCASPDAPVVQQSFQLKHDVLGEMELFLVPVKKNESGVFYEAVFNRLLA